jgi:hypothetical protein
MGGVEVFIQEFLIAALDGDEGSALRPGRFTHGKGFPISLGLEARGAFELVWTL